MNQTHFPTVPTKTNRTPGLVGDLCVKVVGDCSKFMECRMNENNLAWNISTCQCLDGYLPDRSRNCRKPFLLVHSVYLFKNSLFY